MKSFEIIRANGRRPSSQTLAFGKRIGWIAAGNATFATCGLVALPFLLRTYSIADFSAYAGVVAIQQFCAGVAFTATGVGAAASLSGDVERRHVASVVRAEVLCGVGGALFFVLALWAFWSFVSSGQSLALYAVAGALGIPFRLTGAVSAAYRALGRERNLGMALGVNALMRLGATVILGATQAPLWMLLATTAVIDALVVSYHRTHLAGNPFGAATASPSDFRRASAWMLLVSLTDGVVNSLDRVIVGAAIGSEAVGPYHAARRYASALGVLADPIYQSFMTDFARTEPSRRLQAIRRACVTVPRRMALVLVPLTVFAFLSRNLWVPLLLPNAVAAQAETALLVLLAGQSVALSFIAVHPALIALNRMRATVFITFIANVTFVAAAIVLGKSWGTFGLAIAVVAQTFSSVGLKLFVLFKESR